MLTVRNSSTADSLPLAWQRSSRRPKPLTGATSEATQQARPVRRRPPSSIHTFRAAVMMAKPVTKGMVQSRRLSLRPARSTSQPPSTPPAAAQGHDGLGTRTG